MIVIVLWCAVIGIRLPSVYHEITFYAISIGTGHRCLELSHFNLGT
jgi:hypothetical protein